jgi:hypothetical protein
MILSDILRTLSETKAIACSFFNVQDVDPDQLQTIWESDGMVDARWVNQCISYP